MNTRVAWVALALIALCLAAYAPLWSYDFVDFDDSLYISNNPEVLAGLSWHGVYWAFTTGHEPYWHPLTWLSHMLDIELYGVNAHGHHFTSVLLHIANTLLLLEVLVTLTGALGRSAFVAALFALHPLRVESVAWIAERKDVLSTLFWMLALWAYARYSRRPDRVRYLTVLAFFVLGLMAKPMVVTLPVVLLLLDYWPLRRTIRIQELIKEKIPFFVLAAVSSVVTFLVAQRIGAVTNLTSFPLSLRLANAPIAYVTYILKMLWPADLAVFYPYTRSIPFLEAGFALLLLAVISYLAWRAAPRYPYIAVGWAWYLVTLLPVIGLFQAGEQARADRFTYVPLIGLFVILAWGSCDLLAARSWSRVALPAAAAVIVLACAMTARAQVPYWQNSFVLWQHTLEVTQDNYIAENNMGNAWLAQGQAQQALAHYSEAVRIQPEFALAQDNLGIVLVNQGRFSEAIPHFSEAIRIKPDFAEAHNDLGVALTREGRTQEAVAQHAEAVRLKPGYALAHFNLGSLLAQQGRLDEAIRELSQAVAIQPGEASFHFNLGAVLNAKGDTQRALGEFTTALQLKPGYPEARRAVEILTHP